MQKTTFGPLKCCVIANGAIYILLLYNGETCLSVSMYVPAQIWDQKFFKQTGRNIASDVFCPDQP